MLGVQTVELLLSLVLGWRHGRSSIASSAYGPRLHWKNESSQSSLPPCPWAPFSSLDQVVQSWMEELAEGHKEEIWEEGGGKFWLGGPPSLPPSKLALQEFLKATLGLPLDAHILESVG